MFNRNGWGRSIFKYHSISKHLSASLFVFAVFGRFLGGNHDNSQPAEAWHRLNYPAYNWVIWSRRNMTWQVEDFPWFSYMIIMAGTNLVRTATVCIVSCGFCRSPSWSSQTGSLGSLGSGRGKFQVGGQRRSGDGAFRTGCRDDAADLNHFFGMGMCRFDSFGR